MGADQVLEKEIVVTNVLGLHARPAAQLVKIASGFKADMSVEKLDGDEEGEADCRSVLSLLMLAAAKGSHLMLRASGPDAEQALGAVVDFFESKFGEE